MNRVNLTEAQFAAIAGKSRGKPVPRDWNKIEAEYANVLEGQRLTGAVIWWAYEALTLKLGPDCRYTPDFFVMLYDGLLECHEVKARSRAGKVLAKDDAMAKLRVAAGMFPLTFVLASRGADGWTTKRIHRVGV